MPPATSSINERVVKKAKKVRNIIRSDSSPFCQGQKDLLVLERS
jgi:hypothetical protein